MIASVISSDGFRLYCKVQANPVTFATTQDQLRKVAKDRTRADLLTDDYFPTPEEAATSPAGYSLSTIEDLVGEPLDDRHLA